MKVKNSISTTMRTLKCRETKDKAAKNIFSYKPIMGNILKYTVQGLFSGRDHELY